MKLFYRYFAKLGSEKQNYEPIYTVLIQEYSDDYTELTDIYAISVHLKSRLHVVDKLHYSRSSHELELIFWHHFNFKFVAEDVASQVIEQLYFPQEIMSEHHLYGKEVFHADLQELSLADGSYTDVSKLNIPKRVKVKSGL